MQALYGEDWVRSAAVALGIRNDKIVRMADGREYIYPHTAQRIEALLLARKVKLEGEA